MLCSTKQISQLSSLTVYINSHREVFNAVLHKVDITKQISTVIERCLMLCFTRQIPQLCLCRYRESQRTLFVQISIVTIMCSMRRYQNPCRVDIRYQNPFADVEINISQYILEPDFHCCDITTSSAQISITVKM